MPSHTHFRYTRQWTALLHLTIHPAFLYMGLLGFVIMQDYIHDPSLSVNRCFRRHFAGCLSADARADAFQTNLGPIGGVFAADVVDPLLKMA